MVSLWGSKKNDDDGKQTSQGGEQEQADGASSSSRPRSRRSRDANERTRLLDGHPPPRRDGYLSPDDPAVSPYNLWTVRLLRYFTVLFTMLTFIWWVLLLVSIFVTPPGLNTRGSGFTDFSYACLTLGLLGVSLIFFAGPSRAMRLSMGIVALLLFVDMIIIVSVQRIREEEGGPGIAASIWALLISLWCVMTDRVVAWGKREEEERLTGRPETRRTVRQWFAVLLGTSIAVIYIIIAILLTATLILRATDAGLQFEGKRFLVDGHKYRVHLNCIGNTTTDPVSGKPNPTILLEAGETPVEHHFEKWAYAAYKDGDIPRYCYWDRPGYAWSDNAPSPHSAGMSAQALTEALKLAKERGPWITVSAGYGSIVSRIFTASHPHEMVGMMLVDPLHEDLLHRIGNSPRGFVLWGYGVMSPLGLWRLSGALFKGRNRGDRVYGNSVWDTGKFLKAKLQENLVAETLSKSQVESARDIMERDMPLVVVSSGEKIKNDKEWNKKQKDLTKLTKKLVGWHVVDKAPHEVWMSDEGKRVMTKSLKKLVKEAQDREER